MNSKEAFMKDVDKTDPEAYFSSVYFILKEEFTNKWLSGEIKASDSARWIGKWLFEAGRAFERGLNENNCKTETKQNAFRTNESS